MGYRLRPKAANDILMAMNYIAADNQRAALKWKADVFETFGLLARMPEIGTRRPEIRKELRLFPKGSYIIFYAKLGGEIEIVRVLHSSRHWQKLLR